MNESVKSRSIANAQSQHHNWLDDAKMFQITQCDLGKNLKKKLGHLNNYFRLHVCLSFCQLVGTSHIAFRQGESPVRLLLSKVRPSYVYSVSKPPSQSSRSSVRLLMSEVKPSYVYSIIKPPGQSSRSPVKPLLSKVNPSYVYSILKPSGQSSRSQVTPILSEAKPSYLCILDSKTTWSESRSLIRLPFLIILGEVSFTLT